MSILIKNMEMPHDCEVCPCLQYFPVGTFACGVTHTMIGIGDKLKDCPLVEVPTPHGRLIDADELEKDAEWSDYYDEYTAYSECQIGHAPTVIEAEGE